MSWPAATLLAFAVAVLTWIATARVLAWLTVRAILDRPNARSSHAVATPRGAGLAVLATVLPAWALAAALDPGARWAWPLVLGALVVGTVSWIDDRRGLSPAIRLAVQAVAVAIGVAALPGPVFQGLLPPFADALAAGLAWLWFVNLFNFMDGIDGISGVEATVIGTGVALLAAQAGDPALGALGLALAAAALGFLGWNWPPARVFLGDVGSVPMGYLAGGLLLALAADGAWAAAAILPLYYLADATITLVRRGLGGEPVWRAHREHFYQRAVAAGLSHRAVTLRVATAGAALAALALTAAEAPWAALAFAAMVVLLLLFELGRPR